MKHFLVVIVPAAALALAALLVPLWPLGVLAVFLLVLGGQWFAALMLGLCFDLLWGAPQGAWRWAALPLTLVVAVAALSREYLVRRLRPRARDRL